MNSLLSEQIMPLTVAERLQLIEEIWNSISNDESEIALTSAQQEEIERRLASYTDIKNQVLISKIKVNLGKKSNKNLSKIMYSVKISEEAELDLEEAYFWYEEQVKQLGSEFE